MKKKCHALSLVDLGLKLFYLWARLFHQLWAHQVVKWCSFQTIATLEYQRMHQSRMRIISCTNRFLPNQSPSVVVIMEKTTSNCDLHLSRLWHTDQVGHQALQISQRELKKIPKSNNPFDSGRGDLKSIEISTDVKPQINISVFQKQ